MPGAGLAAGLGIDPLHARVVGAALTWVLPGRLRVVRVLWMGAFYIVWDAAALDSYIHDPKGFLPGNKMAFPGLKDAADRALEETPDVTTRGFVVDAWLANWDVVGLTNDNVKVSADGTAYLPNANCGGKAGGAGARVLFPGLCGWAASVEAPELTLVAGPVGSKRMVFVAAII